MHTTRNTLLAVLVLGLAACTTEDATEDAATVDTIGMDTLSAAGDAAAASADVEFLRRMADHHQGLIAMGMEAMNTASDAAVRSMAHQLHEKQQAESDSMVAMVERLGGPRHQPQIIAKNQAQVDTLRQRTGAEVDRYFIDTTIAHHREGSSMIDEFLPRMQRPEVRSMAERMKQDQQREIQELERLRR